MFPTFRPLVLVRGSCRFLCFSYFHCHFSAHSGEITFLMFLEVSFFISPRIAEKLHF